MLGSEPQAEIVSFPAVRDGGQPALADSLRISEEVFQAIFEEAGIGMALVDLEGRLIATNRALREILGYTDEELRRMRFPEFTHPEDVQADWELFQELMRGERHRYHLDKRYLHKDGHVVHGRLTASLVRNSDGSSLWAVGMVEDVTELMRTGEERKRLRARLAAAQEEERQRIAEDLHDDPIQKMTAVGMRLATLARTLDGKDQQRQVATLQETVADTIGRLRSLMFDLRPPELDREGLGATIRQLLHRVQEDEGLRWELEDRLACEPPPEVRSAVYRIVQEALNNVRKHAAASTVIVVLESDGRELRGRVRDDGVGFDSTKAVAEGHLGLAFMRERAELLGGHFAVETAVGRGTTARFSLPLQPVS